MPRKGIEAARNTDIHDADSFNPYNQSEDLFVVSQKEIYHCQRF